MATKTLEMVVQLVADTDFGPHGFANIAQSDHAAQNLNPKAKTLHAASGLIIAEPLQTARL